LMLKNGLFRAEWLCFYSSVNCCVRSVTLSEALPLSGAFLFVLPLREESRC